MPPERLHIGIVGAGLGGLAAAIGIARAGHQVTILEQAKELGEIGAGIQVPPNASRILHEYGILDKIQAVAVQPKAFFIRSYRDGKILNKLEMARYAERAYGYPYLHIHRADYHRIMLDEARRLGVELRLGSAVTSIDFQRCTVRLRDKSSFRADLLVGCDGLKSVCREALLEQPDPPRFTGDLAYRIVIKVEDMKRFPDLEELIDRPYIHYWLGPRGHVVLYLLQGGDLCNIVLIAPDNLPELVSTAKADLQEMMDYFENWDPKLKRLLGLVQETMKWRLQNSEEMERWTHPSGTFALLGDACHATLPYLAQGAAQAVEDGAVLGRLFEHIHHHSQIPDILTVYEDLRKTRTTRVVKGSTGLRDVFHLEDGPLQHERDRQLLEEEAFEGYPNPWADPVFQPWLFGYDSFSEADNGWRRFQEDKVSRMNSDTSTSNAQTFTEMQDSESDEFKRPASKKLRFADVGINLSDATFRGVYHGKQAHEDDKKTVIQRAVDAGCAKFMITGSDLEESEKAVALAEEHPGLCYATLGVHPCSANKFDTHPGGAPKLLEDLEKLANEAKSRGIAVAFGEIGLDYDRLYLTEKDQQLKYFEVQLDLAVKVQLPLFLHMRAASSDFERLLQPRLSQLPKRGLVHSFTGSLDEMKSLIALDLDIGVNGCSMKNEENLEVVKEIPLERLQIETDGPWCEMRPSHASAKYKEGAPPLPPSVKKEKWRQDAMVKGRNEPCTISHVAHVVAKVKGISIEEVCDATWNNSVRMFGLGEQA